MNGFGADLAALDVRSTRAVVARLLERGLRAERVDAWPAPSVRLRAPAGVWTYQLDVPWAVELGRIEATWWGRDACRSEAHVRHYAILCRPEMMTAEAATERARRALDALGRCYPSLEVLSEALGLVVAMADAAGAPERLASVEEVASVLGCESSALRARMRRGDVRSVAVGRRRAIPWSEVERLVRDRDPV